MGASAGTGIRSFAEGGSTSAPTGGTGFGRINPAAINVDPRAFGIGPAAESLRQDLAREQAPPRQIYRPQYEDYGLGSTPQAQGQLAALLNIGSYGNQMPTFTRPQAGPPQAQYSIPYSNLQDPPKKSGRLFSLNKVTDPNLAIIDQALLPPQAQNFFGRRPDVEISQPPVYMDPSQRNAILENPGYYLDYAKYVQSGGDPAQFSRQIQPIQYMTQAQREALMKKQRSELNRLLPQARPDDNSYG